MSVHRVPPFFVLADWLAWQEKLHVNEIQLGLDRCLSVAKRLNIDKPNYRVVTVGGTNGKGSSVGMLSSIYRAADYKTATYTSPHLMRYNERVRINDVPVSDDQLCDAFSQVNEARADISLTYFEFGTLAAFYLFAAADLDVAILEVGLGGRLDAVNILDADVALITAIGIDHVEWLGNTREAIMQEKAGILRANKPAICSDRNPPSTLEETSNLLGSQLFLLDRDYSFIKRDNDWVWRCSTRVYENLPFPNLIGEYQFQNAAGVLMAIEALSSQLPVNFTAIGKGLRTVSVLGRFQIIPGDVEYILDVAHNPHAAQVLVNNIRQRQATGRTFLILGMLKDKDVRGFLSEIEDLVDQFFIASLPGNRAASAELIAGELSQLGVSQPIECFPTVAAAIENAKKLASQGDRILITGSFLTVSAAMHYLGL